MSDSTSTALSTGRRVRFTEIIQIFDIPAREPFSPAPASPPLVVDPPQMETEDLLEDTVTFLAKLKSRIHYLGSDIAPLCPDSDLLYFGDLGDAILMGVDEEPDPASWELSTPDPEMFQTFAEDLAVLGNRWNRLGFSGHDNQLDVAQRNMEETLARGTPKDPEVATRYLVQLREHVTKVREFAIGVEEQIPALEEKASQLKEVLEGLRENVE